MAFGNLKFDTLTTSDAKNTSAEKSIDTSYIFNGVAKAWINAPDGLASILDSYNVSSLDDDGTGDGGVHITNDMSSANYVISGMTDDDGTSDSWALVDITNATQAAGSFDFETHWGNAGNNRTNSDIKTYLVVHGDLA